MFERAIRIKGRLFECNETLAKHLERYEKIIIKHGTQGWMKAYVYNFGVNDTTIIRVIDPRTGHFRLRPVSLPPGKRVWRLVGDAKGHLEA